MLEFIAYLAATLLVIAIIITLAALKVAGDIDQRQEFLSNIEG